MFDYRKWCRILVVSAVTTALFACGSTPINPPAELKDVSPEVWTKRLWKKSVGIGGDKRELEFQFLLSGDQIVTIDAEGRINSLDGHNGKRQWRRDLDDSVIGGLAEDAQHFYFSNYEGQFVAVDKDTLKVKWKETLANEVLAPAASNGQVVAVQSISDSIFVLDVNTGKRLWQYSQETPLLSLRGTASPLMDGERLITSFANGEMYAFDLRTGEVLWRYVIANPSGRTELERLIDADGAPILDRSIIYTSAYQGAIAAIDARTGSELWNVSLSTASQVAVFDDTLFAALDDGAVVALDKLNGEELWRTDELSYRKLGSPEAYADLVIVDDFEGYIHVLSAKTGDIIGRLRPDSDGVMGNLIITDHHIYAYTNDGHLVAYHYAH